MSQTNTREGDIPVNAGEDLTGKEGYLVKMTHASGIAEVLLPDSVTAYAFYLIIEGAEEDETVSVRPLDSNRNVRVFLKDTCNPGDTLILADPATAADKGRVRSLPAVAGTYRGLFIAEEAGVDGQLVLCRPAPIGTITVT